MGNDMRTVKFRMMIKDIYEDLDERDLTNCVCDDSGMYLNEGYSSVWLALLYDYDKLNEYGKIIIEQVSKMTDKDKSKDETSFSYQVKFVEKCQDIEYRTKAAKAIIKRLNGESIHHVARLFSEPLKLHFLFWSLMILAVDDTDKEEHLSLICDFAKMLKVGDAELMDMIRIIQAIYDMEGDYKIQTNWVMSVFGPVINKYIATADKTTTVAEITTTAAGALSAILKGMGD